jgi:formylglycine-generating enzyme
MIGNTWEWTSDFYVIRRPQTHGCCAPLNPRFDDPMGSYDEHEPGGAHIPRRVIKGGSYLCAENYCRRGRPRRVNPSSSSRQCPTSGCVRRDVA